MPALTRGVLAKQGGVNRETIRYYERSGLLPMPERSSGNYCLFDEAAIERLHFIRRAQAAGFTLEEIRQLLAIRFAPESTCGDVREMVEAKIAAVDEKMRLLTAIRDTLSRLIDDCPGGTRPLEECPILESFASAEDPL